LAFGFTKRKREDGDVLRCEEPGVKAQLDAHAAAYRAKKRKLDLDKQQAKRPVGRPRKIVPPSPPLVQLRLSIHNYFERS
jgi:hypothetical protein